MILTKNVISSAITDGTIKIKGFNPDNLNPNSYDVTLSNKIAWYPVLENTITIPQLTKETNYETYGMAAVTDPEHSEYSRVIGYLDPAKENKMIEKVIPPEGVILIPHVLYLAMLNEEIGSSKYVAELTGKSTLARLGIIIHHTAGYSNIGHQFKYVLEIQVAHPIRIYPNMKIGQIYFHTTTDESDSIEYSGNYTNDQMGSHISSPKPIHGYEDVINITPSVHSIAVTDDDITKYCAKNHEERVVENEPKIVTAGLYDPLSTGDTIEFHDMKSANDIDSYISK